MGLLNWSNEPHRITENLSALTKVGGEEVVKFLQDVLDTLFNILMENSNPDLHDDMVFNCLVCEQYSTKQHPTRVQDTGPCVSVTKIS